VDAVETSRGFEPPIFVDIRIRRTVRAKGFVGSAFAKLLGPGSDPAVSGCGRGDRSKGNHAKICTHQAFSRHYLGRR
jgi:hypothetical protein